MDKNTNPAVSANRVEPPTFKESLNQIESVENICADIHNLFEKMKKIGGMYDRTVEKQQHLCTVIPKQIREGIIRIAVVGAIKSGKSTFINSLLMDDILKRGAGVVTSVITRVKRGDTLRARVIFKSWDEINIEIEKALTLTPMPANGSIDLRRKNDRNFLKNVKSTLFCRQWSGNFIDENLNCGTESESRPEAILISNALDGYDDVKEFIQNDPSNVESPSFTRPDAEPSSDAVQLDDDPSYSYSPPVEFTGDNFFEHKRFTGISSNAFFVKDVILEIPHTDNKADNGYGSPTLDPLVEIADCQGSDSTDPSHISHIQDYLLSANMLVYVISSRTGLREADVKFLTIIRRMGILNNIFFIINADFNEHDSLESLMHLERGVKQGLGYLVENPVVYTISSLFNLFSSLEPDLSDKELAILRLWQKESPLVEYTAKMASQFEQALRNKIETERFSTILDNHIERLRVVIQALKQRTSMFMQLLSDDLKTVSEAAINLQQLQEKSKRFETSVDGTIEVSVQTIKRDIKSAIKNFFDKKRGEQAIGVRNFILGTPINNDKYQEMISTFGFNHALYCMFQDFRSKLDLFMAQQFNSAVVQFIHEQEQHIEKELQVLYQSCYIEPSTIYPSEGGSNRLKLQQSRVNHQSLLEKSGQSHQPQLQSGTSHIEAVDLNGARRILGLSLPMSTFATAYSAKLRADAMVRFSFYSLMELIERFINPIRTSSRKSGNLPESAGVLPENARESTKSRALKESAKKIRKEALRSVMIHFDAYQHHVQEIYLFPLVHAVARDLREKLMDTFRMFEIKSENIEQLISDECMDKSDQFEHVKAIASEIDIISDRINTICR